MKTVTLWSVPVDVAKLTVEAMRKKAVEMLTDGVDTQAVQDLLYTVAQIESEIQREEADDASSAE